MQEVFFMKFWDSSSLLSKIYPHNVIRRVYFTRCVIIHAMDSQIISYSRTLSFMLNVWFGYLLRVYLVTYSSSRC
jgi:hypothetical protein